ncbi:transposase [Catovirus CTV1]|uniref:Transposase n=1 Tax=Catovirus CTV1 TaxID=1977631 RepID=A0A1V0S996_9VIRU|nr:transposase [Catovirus CTV1]
MQKDYKKRRKKFIDSFCSFLQKHTNKLPHTLNNKKHITHDSFSWFDINEFTTNKATDKNINFPSKFSNTYTKCKKIKMKLDRKQRIIINKWFDVHTDMYNSALKYIRDTSDLFKNHVIKSKLFNVDNNLINSFKLRDGLIKTRKELILKSQINTIDDDTKIHSHTLDYAVRQLVSNIKSAVTNLKKGNIKRFRLKFWKHSRPSKTMDIEKAYISGNKICHKILGDISYEYNNEEYIPENFTCGVKINYNSMTDEYLLLVPERGPVKETKKTKNIIVLDPGLRTFMTGLSESALYKIGTNITSTVKKSITRLNKIKENVHISKKIKKKNERIINRKITNKIDDMQWKTINFLTQNFKNILLGDMSAKSIVSKNKSVLDNETKVACLRMRFYDFRKRLEYKCNKTKTNYRLINECYTSKICSLCGNYNEKLEGEKIYKCSKCKKEMDRDMNGCRNIMIRSQMR